MHGVSSLCKAQHGVMDGGDLDVFTRLSLI